jgi:Flp pilus assembly protein TadD
VFDANIDEKAEFYLNGTLAADAAFSDGNYVRVPCLSAASAAAHAGTNVLAVHVSNANGPQGIDLSVGVILDTDAPVVQTLNELLEVNPQDSALLSQRAKRHLARQEWEAAARDYERAAHCARNDSFLWMYSGALFAKTGNVAAHEQFCRDMLETLPEGTAATYPERIGKICIFWQGGVVELERATAAILQALHMIDADETLAWLRPWVQAALAIARYRQGNFEETETLCRAALSAENAETAWFGNLAHSLLSMVLARRGQLAEAKAALAKSGEYLAKQETVYAGNPAADGWHDMIISQVLYAEAAAVVGEAAAE